MIFYCNFPFRNDVGCALDPRVEITKHQSPLYRKQCGPLLSGTSWLVWCSTPTNQALQVRPVLMMSYSILTLMYIRIHKKV